MNISRDSNKLSSVIQFDIKSQALDVKKETELSQTSFSDLLNSEANKSVSKFESPKLNESINKPSENPEQSARVSLEENPSYKTKELPAQEKEVQSQEEENEGEDLSVPSENSGEETNSEFLQNNLIHIQSHPKDPKLLETKEYFNQDKNEISLALLKNSEKGSPYFPKTKDNSSFMEEAKKIADSLFKKEKKEFKPKEVPSSNEGKINSENFKTEEPKFSPSKMFFQKENVTFVNFGKSKTEIKTSNRNGSGSVTPDRVSASTKEFIKKEAELSTAANQIPKDSEKVIQKENSLGKESLNRKKPSLQNSENVDDKKQNQFSAATPEKIIRNLGLKDKEFSKSELKTNVNPEKVKTKEQAELTGLTHVNQSSNKEDNGQMGSGNKNSFSNREGMSFANESKMTSRTEEIQKPEKPTLPSRPEMQKNLDDLVKQARFDIVQNGKSTAEIVMNPKEFGRLTLRVSVDGDKVEGRILVDSDEMKDLVTNEISKLKESLKDSGLSLESLFVDVWDGHDSQFSKQSFEDRKFAEEMVKSSYNRNLVEIEEESSVTPEIPLRSSNVIEIFA